MTRGTDCTDMKRVYRTKKEGDRQDKITFPLSKVNDLRYGENPNQPAAIYELADSPLAKLLNITLVKSGKQGLSATNYMDVTRALNILKYFKEASVAVMKHLNPCGFATQRGNRSLVDLYVLAKDTDARSAFGSVVGFNRPVDKASAEALVSPDVYVEVVAAPEYEEGVMDILSTKKALRVVTFDNLDKMPKFVGDETYGLMDIRMLPDGRCLWQEPYLSSIRGPDDLVFDPMVVKNEQRYVVQRDPTDRELRDLLEAWHVTIGIRSNAILLYKDGVTVAVGTGEQERVGALEQAIEKGYRKAMDREGIPNTLRNWPRKISMLSENPIQGARLASDAFFPFRDSIDIAAREGITAIIQPGGSINDHEVIQAVNERDMAMVYTRERCFSHH